jgi:hypothetical protein
VSSSYPIGIFTLKRTGRRSRPTLRFSRVYPVTRFPLPPSSARTSGELERPSPSVGQELIREVREYRSGDNPRHIHWRSSARHDRLMVKQFDAIATSETWIVLDLDLSNHDELYDSLERAIEIAATLASHLIAGAAVRTRGRIGARRIAPTARARCGDDGGVRPLPRCSFRPITGCPSGNGRLHRHGQQWIFDHDRRATLSFCAASPPFGSFRQTSFTEEGLRRAPAPCPARRFAIARNTDCRFYSDDKLHRTGVPRFGRPDLGRRARRGVATRSKQSRSCLA